MSRYREIRTELEGLARIKAGAHGCDVSETVEGRACAMMAEMAHRIDRLEACMEVDRWTPEMKRVWERYKGKPSQALHELQYQSLLETRLAEVHEEKLDAAHERRWKKWSSKGASSG